MNDFMISRNKFLDALVLDADGKTDIIQAKLALEKSAMDKTLRSNNDEIIAAYIREKKPELLDTLSFLVYSMMYRANKAVKSLADAISKMSDEDIAAALAEYEEPESEEEERDDCENE